MPEAVVVGGVVFTLLAVIAVLAWRQAVRLDQLHRQVVNARAGLDALLVRRALAALSLASSGLLDSASSALIAAAVHDCLRAGPDLTGDGLEPQRAYQIDDTARTPASLPRQACESILTQVLRYTLAGSDSDEIHESGRRAELVDQLYAANQRVAYARRFHNDHVARTVALRAGIFARALRLAGHAAVPEPIDIDDALPSERTQQA